VAIKLHGRRLTMLRSILFGIGFIASPSAMGTPASC
jgi:hypothetical protein